MTSDDAECRGLARGWCDVHERSLMDCTKVKKLRAALKDASEVFHRNGLAHAYPETFYRIREALTAT